MPDKEEIFYTNSGKYTKMQMVSKGLKQCSLSSSSDEYETQCEGCPYFDLDCTVEECTSQLCNDAVALLKEQEQIINRYHKADGFLNSHGWRWEDA